MKHIRVFRYPLTIILLLTMGCDLDDYDTFVVPDNVRFRSTFKDSNGNPIIDATVTIWADNNRYSYRTDSSGEYDFIIPLFELPTDGEIGFSVYKEGFKPYIVAYQAPLTDTKIYGLSDPVMDECSNCLDINNSRAHELFHLGDDSFTGSINSQFQKSSDSEVGLKFKFNPPTSGKFKVSFWAKGVQCDNKVVYGNYYYTLKDSPSNGDFKYYGLIFDAEPSIKELTILTSNCSSIDKDDWEFIGLHIEDL